MQICHHNLRLLTEICVMLGIPLALEKLRAPLLAILEFLGILLDTERMEARLPAEKLTRIQATIQSGSVERVRQSERSFPW